MRLLVSQRLVEEVSQRRPPITVSEILHVLRLHVSVAQCDVFGYQTMEADLVVLLMPITSEPTKIQVHFFLSRLIILHIDFAV